MLRQSHPTFDLERIRCAASSSCALLVLASGCSFQPLLLNIWVDGSAWELLDLRIPADEIPPKVTASLNRIDYNSPEEDGLPMLNRIESVGLKFDSWDELCSGPSPPASPPAVTKCDNSTTASSDTGCANFTLLTTAAPIAAGADFFTTTLDAYHSWDFGGKGYSHTCFSLKTGRALAYTACILSVCGVLFTARARQASSVLCLLAAGICGVLSIVCSVGALVSLAFLGIQGLASGPGTWFLVGSALSSMAAVVMVVYHAVKATPVLLPPMENKDDWILSQERSLDKEAYDDFIKQQVLRSLADDEFDATNLTRLDRHRMLQFALRVKAEGETMDEWRDLEQHLASKRGAEERGAMGDAKMFGITRNEQDVLAMDPEALQAALSFCDREISKGKTSSKVPQKLLEPAFQSMDVDRTGTVSLSEFRVALQRCGVSSTRAAVDRILQAIDGDGNGVLDIREFRDFFDEIQEMLRYDAEVRVARMLSKVFCRLCLVFNIAGAFALTIFVIQGVSSELIVTAFPLLIISSTVLCVYMIGIPLLQGMLGRQPAIWHQHFYRSYRNAWRHLLEGPVARIFKLLSKCCSRCRRRGRPENQMGESETEGQRPRSRVIAWADDDDDDNDETPSPRSKPRHLAQRDNTLSISVEEISDLEAPASFEPDSPASSRKGSRRGASKRSSRSRSPASRSSSKAQASKETASILSWISTRASSRESTSPRKTRRTTKRTSSQTTRVTRATRTTRATRVTRFTQSGASPQGRNWLPSFLRSKKAPRPRSTFRQGAKRSGVNDSYDPDAFADATERANFARGQAVGSFSPMQVRDLRLPPPAEPQAFIL
eukprot:TRINITY_DN27511_c0_g1_i1.p1 TRINITY_DN27511_c0_g1~~TRINITY_DN27511_c0_g1_i1.p1  ORF type:complete len:832 (+),score=79.20 TRINITY_DN27511_c0_g1_i1:110-2605(+)